MRSPADDGPAGVEPVKPSGVPLRCVMLDGVERDGFPFTIPALRSLGSVDFTSAVTFFVGENGSGKSTFLEALAWSLEIVTAGSEAVERDETLEHVRPLAQALRPRWDGPRTRRGFFLRAEDFFGYVKRVNREKAWHEREASRVRTENADKHEGEISRITSPFTGSASALGARYGDDMDARSHGEQFLAFFQERLVPGGLYLLDEPEVPLSPARQLTLLSLLMEAGSRDGSQFLIATHSPILMALPGARILSFDEAPIREVPYEELEHVRLTRDFLNRPEAFLKHL